MVLVLVSPVMRCMVWVCSPVSMMACCPLVWRKEVMTSRWRCCMPAQTVSARVCVCVCVCARARVRKFALVYMFVFVFVRVCVCRRVV